MKKLLGLSLLLLASASIFADCTDCDDKGQTHGDYSGQTFMTVRPAFWSASPEKVSLWWGGDRALARECGVGAAFQVVPFGGRTTDECGLARYFMFDQKTSLRVDSRQEELPDVNPTHFGIAYQNAAGENAPFASEISFRPRQSYAGVVLEYWQYLGWNDCCERRWWIDFSTPIEWVKNDVRLTETVLTVTAGTTARANTPANMVEAFKGNDPVQLFDGEDSLVRTATTMNFGKIDGSKSRTRLAGVEAKLGYDYVCTDCASASGYVGIQIPAGNKPKGEFLFEPIVGHNFNTAIMTGGYMSYRMWCGDCDRELWFKLAMNARYFFRNTQTRSFDLRNRPWSRYMLVYENLDAATQDDEGLVRVTPGINVFTRKVRVHARFQHNWTAAFVYQSCGFTGELGYNFYAQQAEKVRLKDAWDEGPAVVALGNDNLLITDGEDPEVGGIQRLSNIGNNNNSLAADGTFADQGAAVQVFNNANRIKACDLNLNSAATPAQLTHTIYGALGYCWDACNWPLFVGVGGSYEYTGVNSAVNRWMVWGKFGFSI